MSTVLQSIAGYDLVDGGDGLYFLTEPGGGKVRSTFFRREPWSRWWLGRDVFGGTRELYVETSVPDTDHVAHIAERLTRPT